MRFLGVRVTEADIEYEIDLASGRTLRFINRASRCGTRSA